MAGSKPCGSKPCGNAMTRVNLLIQAEGGSGAASCGLVWWIWPAIRHGPARTGIVRTHKKSQSSQEDLFEPKDPVAAVY